ncbi:YppG family protein [Halobacillus seohaensis]|uniref:YppG family protein n=1 Tax=Halobacillus seohaensis TaxID=447421 RepID=A0ABW2EMT8_9BACI
MNSHPNYFYWQPPYPYYANSDIDRNYNPHYNEMPYGWEQTMYQDPYMYASGYEYPNFIDPYNGAQFTGEQYANQKKNMINYFQDENGQLDFDKMMSTTGQVMQTIQQVSPMVKGIGTFVKGLR